MNKKQATFTLLLLALVFTTTMLASCGEYTQVSLPGAPATITATAGNTEATVSFTAPASNGGLAITGYIVTSNPPGGVDSHAGNTGLTHTIRSLTNGTTYTFTVHATNALGSGAESAASNAIIPAVIPGAPTIGTATGGIAQATVTFTAPASDGGSAITGYTVTSMPAGGLDSNAGTTALSHVITNLTNGTDYTFTVTATNSAGTSVASAASIVVTPVAAFTAPNAPTIGTATGGDAQATVTFTAPANSGGKTITGYTVTSSPGGITASGPASPLTVTGLTNLTPYTFTVTATNSVGTSDASAASNAVTPFAPVTVVQNQTASQSSYDTSSNKALPGSNDQGPPYQFGSPLPTWWWGGVSLDSVFVGYGVDSTATGAGLAVFVKGAGSTTWNVNGASTVVVGLGTNPDCVGKCRATLVLVSSTANCKATAKSGILIQTAAVNTGLGVTAPTTATTYTKALTDANWTVTGCTTNTMASFLALPLKEVHAQMLQADMQFTTPGAGSTLYPNGINLGGISFR